MHFWKIISTFHKDYPAKLTATFLPLDFTPPMAQPLVKPIKSSAKQKQDCSISSTKWVKEWNIGRWDFSFSVLVRLEGFFNNSVSFGKDTYLVSSFNFIYFLSISSILPLRFLSMSSILPLYSLFMSGILPIIFRFSSLVSHQVKRFFIRLIPRFSSFSFSLG